MKKTKPYRRCVLAVFQNLENKVLVAQRSDSKSWQFPQGGVDEGEDLHEALFREMKEELGSDEFEILQELPDTICYEFPKTPKFPISQKYRGQEQTWFLCRFKAGAGPHLGSSTSEEFLDIKWVNPDEILKSIIEWKKEAYKMGLSQLKLL